MSKGEHIGEVTHYFNKIDVAVLRLTKPLNIGTQVRFAGTSTDFTQEINSMQIDHDAVDEVLPGDDVAVKVDHRVRAGDLVYRVEDQAQ